MLMIVTLAALAATLRAGWQLHRLWPMLPRDNRDFGWEGA